MGRLLDSYFNKYSQKTITTAYLRMHRPSMHEDAQGNLVTVGWKYEVWESKAAHDAGAPVIGDGGGTFQDFPERSHEASLEEIDDSDVVVAQGRVVDAVKVTTVADEFNEFRLNMIGRTSLKQVEELVLAKTSLKGRDI